MDKRANGRLMNQIKEPQGPQKGKFQSNCKLAAFGRIWRLLESKMQQNLRNNLIALQSS
jgi:hypothetical protein